MNLVVRDEREDEPPLVTEGQRRRAAFLNHLKDLDLPDKPSVLPPGQFSSVWQWSNGLSAWYKLKPGRYTAELTYREDSRPTKFEIRSAKVPFEVVSAAKEAANGGAPAARP